MNAFKADLMMFFVTICWGSSYLFMKMGLDTLSEFNLIALRFGLAFLLAAALFYRRLRHVDRETLKFSIILGSILFLIFTMLTYGLKTTTTSNAGFLVSLTVIFVPILNTFVFKNKIDLNLKLSILIALTGIAFLTVQLPFHVLPGDLLCVMCAFLYAIHIIITGHAAPKVDTLNLGIIQLGVAGFWGLLFSVIFENPVLPSTKEGWISILALSILCSALGFIIQTVAQKYTSAARTGLIFSLEPVFAALFGYLFIQEIMSGKEFFGAFLVLFSIVFTTIRREKQTVMVEKRGA
ncbi:DMT family transporter [Bacillus sp. DTU_2020_1000418_1_SI_GHA_SEK_038]|uniref:DMT family transporter n=1 Tax=Bacillus sp. DTU_2020_1000418_1_SI_GHA_SEK_038 TaxID=3077585 RepID=UPI0028E5C675|nr:DMT family transporter [Bacillus sp. DTU_2020_1000418_1_SI_GHA_SEK_038]WNS76258.1 DMT family transporter [Bacillus sp. DTU_2020_1000418_1_SI_GHA_SEK_038]